MTLVVGDFELLKRRAPGHLPVARGPDAGRRYVLSFHPAPSPEASSKEDRAAVVDDVARIAALSGHPHLPELVDAERHRDGVALILSPVPTGTLAKRLHNSAAHRFSASEARHFFQQLVFTLKYAHDRGAAHGAITARDLLLRDATSLLLVGVGTHRLGSRFDPVHERNVPSALLDVDATAAAEYEQLYDFRAPEVLAAGGEKPATHEARVRADVYACGALLYAMLSGQPPGRVKTTSDSGGGSAIDSSTLTQPPAPELQLAESLMAVDPARRRSIASLLDDEWFLGTGTMSSSVRRLSFMRQQQLQTDGDPSPLGGSGVVTRKPSLGPEGGADVGVPAALEEMDSQPLKLFADSMAAAQQIGLRPPTFQLQFFGTVADGVQALERRLGFHTFGAPDAIAAVAKPAHHASATTVPEGGVSTSSTSSSVTVEALKTESSGNVLHFTAAFAPVGDGDDDPDAAAAMDSITSQRGLWSLRLSPLRGSDARLGGVVHDLRRMLAGVVAKSSAQNTPDRLLHVHSSVVP